MFLRDLSFVLKGYDATTANNLNADGTDVVSGTQLGPDTMIASRCGADADMHGGVAVMTDMTPLATSNEIRDRGSAFVGYVHRARTTEEARAVVAWRRQRDLERIGQDRNHHHHHPTGERGGEGDGADRNRNGNAEDDNSAPYTIAAWRCMVVKRGRTGLGGPDEFEVEGNAEDGGERYAGKKILAVMQREGVIDAVVTVSRWFGGILLGPARFTHIQTCASEVCRKFKKIEEMEECIQTLERLDEVLATLRAQWAVMRTETRTTSPNGSSDALPGPDKSQAKGTTPDYRIMEQDLDLNKAKRLIHARESAIQNTKILIEKYKAST